MGKVVPAHAVHDPFVVRWRVGVANSSVDLGPQGLSSLGAEEPG